VVFSVTDFEKILVVRVGHGGDLVMITPALNALLEAFPGADVHLLTTREGSRVMKGYHPRLTRVWFYHRRFPHHLWLRRRLRRELREQNYTRVFVFESNPYYHRMLEGIAPAVYRVEDHRPGVHYCDRCLELVAGSKESPVQKGWITLPVSKEGIARARALLAEHGVEAGIALVGLHPTFSGSSMPFFRDRRGMRHRIWPRESFAKLARELDEKAQAMRMPLRIVIDALPEERALVETIVEQSGGVVTLLTAPPDFERYKGVLKCLDVLVTPNTGPMHIAAAVGTPVVALFSGWSAEECGPFVSADRYRALRAEDTAQPERGLAAIAPDPVADAVFQFLPAARTS
jgi:ADP-heptose:LPS heptosyltransferase